LKAIRGWKIGEKELRPVGDRSVEFGFGFCFQQKSYPRVSLRAESTGRGLQKSAKVRVFAKIERQKPDHGM
jgi:hypothetical protein